MSHALSRQEFGRSNGFLETLLPHDFSLLAPHLRTVALERGAILHNVGEEIERVYFPQSGIVSLVAVIGDNYLLVDDSTPPVRRRFYVPTG